MLAFRNVRNDGILTIVDNEEMEDVIRYLDDLGLIDIAIYWESQIEIIKNWNDIHSGSED